ncbi:hypothetical protein [Holdemania sp. 1001302B_160321_E10]|uniref:hypothetical protein n=1 Tax=Holdemania sp. 1001302B_160321_E10 TaxID=2787120 RepID=UPI001E5CD0E3|nr:hypothetical protein [Holdemania sp. 1001302B_160321_E10]
MRLRQCRIKTYSLKRHVTARNEEGNTYSTWGSPVEIDAEIWPAGGQLQAQIYGQELQYMLNMLYQGDQEIKETDGICVFGTGDQDPDYQVISQQRYANHQFFVLKKL